MIGQGLDREIFKDREQRGLGKLEMGLSEKAKRVKRCASHVNAVQKTSNPEDVLINQVDRVTRLADTN